MPMRFFLVLPIYRLLQIARGQLKNCYDLEGTVIWDYPCDPSVNVSACCGFGGRCVTNLFCMSAQGYQIVGTCTDKSWANDACPWPLNKSTAAVNFDHFKYSLNTTSCPDKTICPGPKNQSCCDAKKGRKEIDFGNTAEIPKELKDLRSYYEAAGYTIPSRAAESSTSGSSRSESAAQRTPSSRTLKVLRLLSSTQNVNSSISTCKSASLPSSTCSSERNQASGGSGLSISAKVIAGAAASIAVLLLLISCLYLIHSHRLKYRAVNLVRSAELDGTGNGQEVEKRRNLSELQGSPTAVELDETNPK